MKIRSADRVRDGVLVEFLDGVVILLPTTLLFDLRESHQITRVTDSDDAW